MSFIVEDKVIEHSKAKGNIRLVLFMIAKHAHDDGKAWPGSKLLMRECNISSPSTFFKCIDTLVHMGELICIPYGGPHTTNLYYVSVGLDREVVDQWRQDLGLPTIEKLDIENEELNEEKICQVLEADLEAEPLQGLYTPDGEPLQELYTSEEETLQGLYTPDGEPLQELYTPEEETLQGLYTSEGEPLQELYTSEEETLQGLYTSDDETLQELYTPEKDLNHPNSDESIQVLGPNSTGSEKGYTSFDGRSTEVVDKQLLTNSINPKINQSLSKFDFLKFLKLAKNTLPACTKPEEIFEGTEFIDIHCHEDGHVELVIGCEDLESEKIFNSRFSVFCGDVLCGMIGQLNCKVRFTCDPSSEQIG